MYGPTNMQNIFPVQSSRLAGLLSPAPSPGILRAWLDYDNPPTETPITKSLDEFASPRVQMTLSMFNQGVIPEFLLTGLVPVGEEGRLRLPFRGCVSREEIDEISMSMNVLCVRNEHQLMT